MHVHDELASQTLGALVGHIWAGRFRRADTEDGAVDVVHRHEGRRHAGRGLEERAATEPLVLGEPGAKLLDARLDLLLLLGLGWGGELVAGDELGGDRRREG